MNKYNILSTSKITKNQEKFIGYSFINRKGFIVKVIGVDANNKANYLCTCSKCSLDLELFPDAFSITKAQISNMNQTPCGCSKTPKYSEIQWLILVRRECDGREYKIGFKGWHGEFKFAKTKLLLSNLDNGCEWSPTINKFYNQKSDDPITALYKRSQKRRRPLVDIEQELNVILCKEGGKFLMFSDVYTNIQSKFKWICDRSHLCETRVSNFLSLGRRCRECNKGGYTSDRAGNLYIARWYNDDISYLKVGITNSDIEIRLSAQKSKTSLNYKIIRTFTYPDGSVIAKCEKHIKSTLACNICPRELLPDGFTETMEDNGYNLSYMLNYLSFYLF